MQPLHTINHAISQQQKNHATSLQKHCKNRKTLPSEHHISFQISQIALSKSTDKVFFTVVTAVTVVTVVRKDATSPKKPHNFFFLSFFSVFLECEI